MRIYRDETGKETKARNYKEAAELLYGQQHYTVPGHDNNLQTTYCARCHNFAAVSVYQVGDKQGTYWGVQAASPIRHTLLRM